MTIDWLQFSPWASLAGGVLIGLSAGVFVVLNGRIAGISGLLASLVERNAEGRSEKFLFLLGLVLSPVVWLLFGELPAVRIDTEWPALMIAGVLVGLGTRYGSGCTSGHGVCGIARLSSRSIIATLMFMASGFATVFVVRHLLGI